jgi:hypothetical protein
MLRRVRLAAPTLALLAGLLTASPGLAQVVAEMPIPLRLAIADVVVVGKVAAVSAKVDAQGLRIATVDLDQTLTGKTANKKIEVGIRVSKEVKVKGIGGGGLIIRPLPTVQLTPGQEVVLFLPREPGKKELFLVQLDSQVITKKEKTEFAAVIAEVKKLARLLDDPQAGLKSKKASERVLTATMLIARYRSSRGGSTKTEPIPADESKRILLALAEADWDKRDPKTFAMSPKQLFSRLGLTIRDGWTPPDDPNQFAEEAKKWLTDNAGKFRLQRFVWPSSEDKNSGKEK